MSEIQGNCDDRFDGLREVFASQLASGEDLGASLVPISILGLTHRSLVACPT